jgi:hypothetical protein
MPMQRHGISQPPGQSQTMARNLLPVDNVNVNQKPVLLYSLLHRMLRESGFGANVFPLVGCNGALLIKVAFNVRTKTPAAMPEGGPLILSAKTAPWLRAVLHPTGRVVDQGFSFSPHDWSDLLMTMRLREALYRRDGRRRTYFCCQQHLLPNGRVGSCGKRLLDQNELGSHIQAEHPPAQGDRRQREMIVHSEELRRKSLAHHWTTVLSRMHAVDAWASQQTLRLLSTLPSESLASFMARRRTARDACVTAGNDGNISDDDDVLLTYERVRLRDPTAMTKIECPGRGSCCRHLQCFDLRVHTAEAFRKRAQQAHVRP